MKKLNLLPFTILTTTIGFTPIVLTSCGGSKEESFDSEEDEVASKYIHDRTFSLLGSGTSGKERGCSWGTCWIISDATPDDYDDYQYYIATNWHVVLGQQSIESLTNYHVYFGDNTKSSGLSVLNDYTQFYSYTLESESKFCYSNKKDAIDFYVAKADFRTATGSTKTKLDSLNTLQKEKGYITQFTDPTESSKSYIPSKMYTAGFPVKRDQYATWERHKLNSSTVGMYYKYYGETPHNIDDEVGDYVDNSPQYTFKSDMGSSWMSGGASGSMLLGKYDDGYKVCGIYWGGWTNEAKTALYPSYSIFRSDKKDFISSYI